MEFQIKEIFMWVGGGMIALSGWFVGGLISAACGALRDFLVSFFNEFKRFTSIVEALVTQMAENNVRVNSHEKRIDKIEIRLEEL